MERNFFYVSDSENGYENLAADEWFLDHLGPDDLVLYLYQNRNDVIIGKNQNPWLECDLRRMDRDGVRLVRRISGGGAVYHDLGNLNFSFIASSSRYDTDRQFSVIVAALHSLGLDVSFSGRNDLILDGKKISGNAFAARKSRRQHHGTLLVSSDLDRLSSYLTVSEQKIRSKGIASVRSRVCNLSEYNENVSVHSLEKALERAFGEEYGYYSHWQFSPSEKKSLKAYVSKHASEAWFLGESPTFDFEWNHRLAWGNLQLLFTVKKGRISSVKGYSDSMDPEICTEAEEALRGIIFTEKEIRRALALSHSEELRSLSEHFSFS